MPILKRSKVLTAMALFYAVRPSRDFPRRNNTPEHALSLVLYQRDDCHLCDLAMEALAAARVPEFESVFIDSDDSLEERYGYRVPVLRHATSGLELDWPFDDDSVRRFVESACSESTK
jgi:hypothetical protein